MGNENEFRNRDLIRQTPDLAWMLAHNVRLAPKQLQRIYPGFNTYYPLEAADLIYVRDAEEKPKQSQIIFQIMGGSAAGKNTVLEQLKKRLDENNIRYATIKTATTRERRIDKGEPEEAHHWMRPAEFKKAFKDHLLIERIHQGNHWYGAEYTEFDKAILDNSCPIVFCEADVYGYPHIKKHAKQKGIQVVGVYLLPDMLIRDYAKRIIEKRGVDFFWRFPKAIAEIKRALGIDGKEVTPVDAFVLNSPTSDEKFTDVTDTILDYLASKVNI